MTRIGELYGADDVGGYGHGGDDSYDDGDGGCGCGYGSDTAGLVASVASYLDGDTVWHDIDGDERACDDDGGDDDDRGDVDALVAVSLRP